MVYPVQKTTKVCMRKLAVLEADLNPTNMRYNDITKKHDFELEYGGMSAHFTSTTDAKDYQIKNLQETVENYD